jgi:progressive ankylosis protein
MGAMPHRTMASADSAPVTTRGIMLFWLPLMATWLMMSVEGPFLAAVIARLADPKYNLAAYGVAFSFALMVEAPIIMMMSASTALVSDRLSYRRLRNFTLMLNGGISVVMLVVIYPPVFSFIARDLIGLPEHVAELTHHATAILLPWPAAIGFRRFYQGLLIRGNLTRRVAYGTVVRLLSMAGTALFVALLTDLPGSSVGAVALSAGVTIEALASRLMVNSSIRRLLEAGDGPATEEMSYRGILSFYYPLALTSMLALGVHPMITFFLGQSRLPLESLAVLPVVNSLVFLFRSFGLSYQEVAIARFGRRMEHFAPVRNFAVGLGVASVAGLALIALTPLADLWFRDLSGLTPALADFALLPAQILVLIPGTSVLLSFQRSVLVATKNTAPVTLGTALEVSFIILTLAIAIGVFDAVGAVAAAVALLVGRLVANAWLTPPMLRAIRAARGDAGEKNLDEQ